ncbi:hypothetical protein AG4045_001321 [Apium graveolens]|uniref:Calmodulin binding protein central domain-containing protein n=1 Tax=Apium graveolens TaxID=4045 RepID=A0A6L5BDU4_APIGR|nr:hypothetical protein AG4045_001321 [Apium graveolens]
MVMSKKRQREDDGRPKAEEDFTSDGSKQRLQNVVLEVMKLRALQQFMGPVLEPLIRRVVKEEFELALQKYTTNMESNSSEEIQPAVYKKHYPPSLFDEVWRLEKIGKEGAFHKRLCREGINTVKDFLILLNQDPTRLRHADARSLVILAFNKWEEVVALDESSLLSNDYHPLNSSMAGSSSGINILSSSNFVSFEPQLDASTSDIVTSFYSMRSDNNMDNFGFQDSESIEVNFDHSLSVPDLVANSFTCDSGSITQSLCADNHHQPFDTLGSFQNPSLPVHGADADLYSLVSEFMHSHSGATEGITKAQRRWRMLFSVLRWFSVRRIVARKSMQQRQAFRSSIADRNVQF